MTTTTAETTMTAAPTEQPKRGRGPTAKRAYVARPKPGVDLPVRLIDATHEAQVQRHLATSLYDVTVAGTHEAIAAAQEGAKLEQAGEAADDAQA